VFSFGPSTFTFIGLCWAFSLIQRKQSGLGTFLDGAVSRSFPHFPSL